MTMVSFGATSAGNRCDGRWVSARFYARVTIVARLVLRIAVRARSVFSEAVDSNIGIVSAVHRCFVFWPVLCAGAGNSQRGKRAGHGNIGRNSIPLEKWMCVARQCRAVTSIRL